MTQTVEITPDEKWTHYLGTMPRESKQGVTETWVNAVEIRGRTYHYISGNEWIDLETGEILQFRCQGIYI